MHSNETVFNGVVNDGSTTKRIITNRSSGIDIAMPYTYLDHNVD